MRPSDLNWVFRVIRASGIATKTQREAIIQRILDAQISASEDRQQEKRNANAS